MWAKKMEEEWTRNCTYYKTRGTLGTIRRWCHSNPKFGNDELQVLRHSKSTVNLRGSWLPIRALMVVVVGGATTEARKFVFYGLEKKLFTQTMSLSLVSFINC